MRAFADTHPSPEIAGERLEAQIGIETLLVSQRRNILDPSLHFSPQRLWVIPTQNIAYFQSLESRVTPQIRAKCVNSRNSFPLLKLLKNKEKLVGGVGSTRISRLSLISVPFPCSLSNLRAARYVVQCHQARKSVFPSTLPPLFERLDALQEQGIWLARTGN